MTTWGALTAAEPELAAFVAERLRAAPSYLATVRAIAAPRVHPVTPIFSADGLYLFMEPTSPKAADLRAPRRRRRRAGDGRRRRQLRPRRPLRAVELRPTEVRCSGYGDVTLPERRRWRADP